MHLKIPHRVNHSEEEEHEEEEEQQQQEFWVKLMEIIMVMA